MSERVYKITESQLQEIVTSAVKAAIGGVAPRAPRAPRAKTSATPSAVVGARALLVSSVRAMYERDKRVDNLKLAEIVHVLEALPLAERVRDGITAQGLAIAWHRKAAFEIQQALPGGHSKRQYWAIALTLRDMLRKAA